MKLQPLRLDAWLQLVVDRPLAFIDLETTDADAKDCGVCELGVVAFGAEQIGAAVDVTLAAVGKAEANVEVPITADELTGITPLFSPPRLTLPEPAWQFATRLNPGKPIHPGATRVHGIRDEDVIGCQGIESVLPQLQHVAENYTICGYNIDRFDLAVLRRFGIVPQHTPLEVMGLWLALIEREIRWYSDDESSAWYDASRQGPAPMPPRIVGELLCKLPGVFRDTLSAAYAALYSRQLEGAHGTIADCTATAAVLFGTLALQTDLPVDLQELADLGLDMVGFIRTGPAGPYFSRGRNAGETVANVHALDPGYLRWTLTEAEIRDSERELIRQAIGPDAFTALINAAARGGGGRGRGRRAAAS